MGHKRGHYQITKGDDSSAVKGNDKSLGKLRLMTNIGGVIHGPMSKRGCVNGLRSMILRFHIRVGLG